MSKYITLDNLSQFLNQMKTGGYVASNNNYGGIKTGYMQTGYNAPVKLNNGQAYTDLSMAQVKDSLIQWDKADSNGVASRSNLTPIEIGLDSSRFANRLSFMNPENITIQYSRDGGTTWTDYEASDATKIKLVTSGFDLANNLVNLYCGKKSNGSSQISTDRQKSGMDMLRIIIKPDSYFSLRKILINISSNGAKKSYVEVAISTDTDGTSYQVKGSYEIGGWSGWNSIPLNMSVGSAGIAKYIRMTFFWNEYVTGYADEYDAANASNTKAVTFSVSNISMHGENLWSNKGESNLARYGHIYKYDENQNTIFPKNVTCAELTCGTINSAALVSDNITLRNKTQNHFLAAPADKNGETTWRRIAPADLPMASTTDIGGVTIGTGLDIHPDGHLCTTLDSRSICFNNDKRIQLGEDLKWINTDNAGGGGNLTNMNKYTTAGVYNISGEHTRSNDNLPINNIGGGHTFSGRLFVYDSSLPNMGNDSKDCCITQVLTLSNRVGGDGNMYIRTASGSTKDNLTWSKWGKLQANVEVGEVDSLDEFIDNGMYSGIYTDGGSFVETFVMVVLNDYVVAGSSRTVVQFKYAYDTFNEITIIKYRQLKDNSWTEWKSLNEIPLATKDSIGGIKVANVRTSTPALISGNATTNRYYGVELDKNGKAFVNVPWLDTISTVTYTTNTFSNTLSANKLVGLTSEALTSVNITSFGNPATGKVTEYGIMFNAIDDTTFTWPDSVKWANGVRPCENGTKIGAGLWKILFTYTPGLQVFTATFAKYS